MLQAIFSEAFNRTHVFRPHRAQNRLLGVLTIRNLCHLSCIITSKIIFFLCDPIFVCCTKAKKLRTRNNQSSFAAIQSSQHY